MKIPRLSNKAKSMFAVEMLTGFTRENFNANYGNAVGRPERTKIIKKHFQNEQTTTPPRILFMLLGMLNENWTIE